MKPSQHKVADIEFALPNIDSNLHDAPSHKGSCITGAHFLSMWKAEGHGVHWTHSATDWAEGGPIIEREQISLGHQPSAPDGSKWYSTNRQGAFGISNTPLIAAMRCYVASKLGDEIEIPEELK